MSANVNVSTPPKGMGGAPKWDEGDKRRAMKMWLIVLEVLVAAIGLGLLVWIFSYPDNLLQKAGAGRGTDLTVILAPILAAATGVERMLETIFNIIEGSWKTMVAYLGRGLRWLKNTEIEVKQARQWLADVSARYNQEMAMINLGSGSISDLTKEAQDKMSAANDILALAEKRLSDAEANLSSATDSAGYKSAKAAASIVVGLMIGVIVAQIGSLQMFALMGVSVVPIKIDILITGLIIGSGSYPVHSLVGILQQAKDTLGSLQGYLGQTNKIEQKVAEQVNKALSGGSAQPPAQPPAPDRS